jgi:hypothetical protein
MKGLRRLTVAVLMAAVCSAAGAGPARGGTYTVESCTNGSSSGWAPFHSGPYSAWGNSCGVVGGALHAAITSGAGSTAGWTFTAPADTTIAGFSLTRAYVLPANRAYGTGVYLAQTVGPGRNYYNFEANYGGPLTQAPVVEAASGLDGQTTLTARVDCGGGLDCTGNAVLNIFAARIELRDDSAPALGSVSGSLLAAGALKGTRAVSYAATDRGGGVYREQLVVDGVARSDRLLSCSFGLVVPCPLGTSGTVALDTTRIADGEHDVELILWDATLTNLVRYGPVRITVDNVPPPLSTSLPQIYGTPREGVTVYADDGTWIGAGLTLTRRWQRYEDGAWEDIAGADGPAYAATAQDAGRKLRFRVRASNAEGSTDAYSLPTAALPSAPLPGVPTTTPTASPSPSPRPVTVERTPVPAAPASNGEASLLAFPSAAFQSTGRSTITVHWGERRRVSGTLLRPDGRPVAGARLAVTSRVRALDAEPVEVGHVRTDSVGRFSYVLGAGVSRVVTFGFRDSAALRTAAVTVRVVPRLTLRATAGGQVQGRVAGSPAGLRKVVEIQAFRGGGWHTLASTRLAATSGTFTYRPRTGGGRVRALVRTDPGWPFLTGHSRAVTLRR